MLRTKLRLDQHAVPFGTIGSAPAGDLIARASLLQQRMRVDRLFGFDESLQCKADAVALGHAFARADFRESAFGLAVESDGSHHIAG